MGSPPCDTSKQIDCETISEDEQDYRITEMESMETVEEKDVQNLDIDMKNECRILKEQISTGNSENKEIKERLLKLEKLYEKNERSRILLKNQLNAARKKIQRLEKKVCTSSMNESISKIFNEDQMKFLSNLYKKIPRWCNETIVKALKLRFACGTSGYEELLKQKFPLPSVRTLTKRLENLKFSSGINEEVFAFLKIKCSNFINSIDSDCVLVLDEISIKSGRFYDPSTNCYIGNVTLPGHDENVLATHGLVFMLAGLASRWKQSIALFYTGDSVKGHELKPICEEIITKAEQIGLRVHAVTSDMSSVNQGM